LFIMTLDASDQPIFDASPPDLAGEDAAGAPAPAAAAPMLERYFHAMVKVDASDLHIKPGTPPHLRVHTEIRGTRSEPISPRQAEQMAMELMAPKQRAFFEEHGSIDMAYELPGSDRFRINVFRQRGMVALAVRRVTRNIPGFATLHLPPVIQKIADMHHGLILIAGIAGSGKSTTIAAMLDHINNTRACHILTVEDPIEYLYAPKKAIVSQREIGIDVANFEDALKYLTREDPDVVLIGELRDPETFQAALQAAETGHLVMGTIHASSSYQTLGRILDLFPAESRKLIRQSLAFNLQAIICQKLMPSIAKGVDRVPAVEVMLSNAVVRQLIEEERDNDLPDAIRSYERDGMQSFTRSLLNLIETNFVDPREAYDVAPNPDELKMLMKGISSSRSGLMGR
jgi:twitching motility protein PilT